jgi:integrase
VSRVQVSFLASIKTPPCVGFLSFYPQLQLSPVGGRAEFIRTYSYLFGSNIGGNGLESGWNKLGTAVLLMAKASAGVPQIKNSHGSLSITFMPKGDKRKYLSLGLPESERNRQYAEMICQIIQNDILAGHFDQTLDKYKRHTSSKAAEPEANMGLILRELWDKYTDYKRSQLSQTTIAVDFDRVSQFVDKFPTKSFDDAVVIRDWLLGNTTPDQAKRVLKQLATCGKWCVRSKLAESNSFTGMAADIATVKGDEELDIDLFSSEERDRLIAYFYAQRSHYATLIEFLFRTGCRPSEAIALEYGHIAEGYRSITFQQAITMSENGLKLKQGLKTQKKRVFPCGDGMKKFLASIDCDDGDRSGLIFTSPQGRFVDVQNFSAREFKPALKALGINERNIYQTRHSYITFCIASGMPIKDVAKLVGNSPEIIYKHYLGGNKNLVAPDF